MKKIVFIFIIVFNFQTLSKASDIFDFDIAKMNIGLSLLHYVSKNEINDKKVFFNAGSKGLKKEYSAILLTDKKIIDKYDALRIYFISSDKNYIIQSIAAYKHFPNKFKECELLKEQTSKNIKRKINTNYKFKKLNNIPLKGSSGIRNMVQFKFEDNSAIKILCYDYLNNTDRFTLIVEGSHFYEFQKKRAYK